MISVEEAVQSGASERMLAQAFLTEYFCEKQVAYPINPFQMLTDLGVPFVFAHFQIKTTMVCIYRPRVKMMWLSLESI